jgi:hypothetical protein
MNRSSSLNRFVLVLGTIVLALAMLYVQLAFLGEQSVFVPTGRIFFAIFSLLYYERGKCTLNGRKRW